MYDHPGEKFNRIRPSRHRKIRAKTKKRVGDQNRVNIMNFLLFVEVVLVDYLTKNARSLWGIVWGMAFSAKQKRVTR